MKTIDRVQANTSKCSNQRIENEGLNRVLGAAADNKSELSRRIHKLETEWDIERLLETNASALAFTGVVLGLALNRKFFAIPCVVLLFLFQHAIQGWCPPIPILRRIGMRTMSEIGDEKYALKALRGDFAGIGATKGGDLSENARQAWNAARA